jgi:hypothetical protein
MTDIYPTIDLSNDGVIYRSTATQKAITLTLENPGDYDAGSIEWTIPAIGGQSVTGNGATFTVEASNPNYNSIGEHTLTLVVRIEGAKYSKIINFEIRD